MTADEPAVHHAGLAEDLRKLRELSGDASSGPEGSAAISPFSEVLSPRPWLHFGPAELQEEIGRLEAAASAVRLCTLFLVPGLLQTREYAMRVLDGYDRTPAEVEAITNARMARQTVLNDQTKTFEFIVTEFGLRWSVPGTPRAVLAAQLSHILELTERPNVSVGVLRNGVQTRRPITQQYIIYEGVQVENTSRPVDVVIAETPAAQLVVREPTEVRVYRSDLAWLREAADFAPETLRRIRGPKH